jgi:hypothetical protein
LVALALSALGAAYAAPVDRATVVTPDNFTRAVETVHALQDAITISQPGGPGAFKIPNWDASSQIRVRDALLELAATVPDTNVRPAR